MAKSSKTVTSSARRAIGQDVKRETFFWGRVEDNDQKEGWAEREKGKRTKSRKKENYKGVILEQELFKDNGGDANLKRGEREEGARDEQSNGEREMKGGNVPTNNNLHIKRQGRNSIQEQNGC